jgi:hypothetical protein
VKLHICSDSHAGLQPNAWPHGSRLRTAPICSEAIRRTITRTFTLRMPPYFLRNALQDRRRAERHSGRAPPSHGPRRMKTHRNGGLRDASAPRDTLDWRKWTRDLLGFRSLGLDRSYPFANANPGRLPQLSSEAPQPFQAPGQAGPSTPLHSYSNAAHVISFRGDGYRLRIACGAHRQVRRKSQCGHPRLNRTPARAS